MNLYFCFSFFIHINIKYPVFSIVVIGNYMYKFKTLTSQ